MAKPKKGTSKDMRLKRNRRLKGMKKNDPRRKWFGKRKAKA